MKKCPKCNIEKSLEFFAKNKVCKDGFQTYCKDCSNAMTRNWAKRNPEKRDAKCKRWRERNIEKSRQIKIKSNLKWRTANPEKYKDSIKKWVKRNPEKMKVYFKRFQATPKRKIIYDRWKSTHRHVIRARDSKRRAAQMNALPKWMDKRLLETIKFYYKICPKGYQVDHIVPLQGKLVSGLHVPWNLQYLTPKENLKKRNNFELEVINYV